MVKSLLKIFKTDSETRKAYKTLHDLPAIVWWDVTEGKGFEGLVIKGKYSELEIFHIYLDLLQEYYNDFGTTEKHESFINARYEYAVKLAKYIETQNGFDKMFMEMALIDLQALEPKSSDNEKTVKFHEQIRAIEKYMGFKVDKKTISTHDFYSYLKGMEQEYKSLGHG